MGALNAYIRTKITCEAEVDNICSFTFRFITSAYVNVSDFLTI